MDRGYSVLLPDLRGHGDSGGKYSGLSNYDADDLKMWIDKYKDDYDISLFGLSMGGLTALRTLIRYPHEKIRFCITDSLPYSMMFIIGRVFI